MSKDKEDAVRYAIRVLNNTLIHFNTLSCNDIKRRMTDIVSELRQILQEGQGDKND